MEIILSVVLILGALLAGAVSPGPSFVLIAKMSMGNSRKDGIAASIGMGIGGVIFSILVLLGLHATLKNVPALYIALKILGGIYIIYLAVCIWRGANKPLTVLDEKSNEKGTTRPKEADSSPTVGDIFRKHGRAYREAHRLHPRQHKVMYDIEHCRCGDFGTHWEICDTCGHLEKGYNSCRNRHCPGCNNIARLRWVEARIKDLLPVSYHHCVFTLPGMFNALCRFNRRIMYDLLFETASQTLLEFGENPKRLGARIGFYGILHTWGGKLWLHPHIHFIVTAGGINTQGQWVEPKHRHSEKIPLGNGKAGTQIKSIRQALADRIDPVPETAENPDVTSQCPACSKGTMITFLVLDGHGNVAKETNLDTCSGHVMLAAESP